VKHAGTCALDGLEPMLRELRCISTLRENSRGVFYRRSKAFLHFHEDPSGLYADVRVGNEFDRYPVNSRAQQEFVLNLVKKNCP
jgi:hypothetical protein